MLDWGVSEGAPTEVALELPPRVEGHAWSLEAPTPAFATHRHAELEVNLALRGSARYLVEGHSYELRPGTTIWLFPAQDHVLLDPSPDFATWLAVFRPSLLERICTDPASRPLLAERPEGVFSKQLAPASASALDSLFEDVTAIEPEAEPARYNAALGYLCLSAWSAHQQAHELPASTELHPAVERAARLLRQGGGEVTVEVIAEQAGLSPSRLTRLFKAQTGMTLTRFRQRQQIERFLDLFGQGRRRSLQEAALDAGFGSYPQFHRVFKSFLGISPAEYRRRRA